MSNIGTYSTTEELSYWVKDRLYHGDWGVALARGITYAYDAFILENKEIDAVVEKEHSDGRIREKINTIYKKIKYRDKRESALMHDETIVLAVNYLRSKGKKYTILTNDTVLKRYSNENIVRNEYGVAIGLDALIGL